MNKQMRVTNFLTKHKTKLQQFFCIGALCSGLVSAGVIAAEGEQSYGKLSKQLDIMNNIFTSSWKAQGNESFKNVKIDSLYLAGQGVVFTIKSSSSFTWMQPGFSFSFSENMAPVAPIAPIAPVAASASSSAENSFEFFTDSDEIAEHMESALELQREFSREFREQQRDLAYNLRDLERESRDLAYQLRNVSKDEKESLVKAQKAIKKQKEALEKSRVVLAKKSKEMKEKQKINQDKKLAARKVHYQQLTTSLVETLCTYGNSLKALPKGEHVSIVLKSSGDKVGSNYQDRILVLSKRDINACVIDKISAKELLASTERYQF